MRYRSSILILLTGIVIACSGQSASTTQAVGNPPHLLDETKASGISHTYDGEIEFFVGGGVATFDCNNDRRPDMYFAGGTQPAALYRNESPVGGPLAFVQVSSPVIDLDAVTGAYPIDIDGDGNIDLVVLRRGANAFLRGLGNCTFEQANEQFGVEGGDAWTTAFSATWEAGNALPTMAFGNFLVPGTTTCDTSSLVRPAPSGTTYAAPITLAPGYCSLSMLFSDWHRTGERDLRLTNDRNYYIDGSDQLWKVTPGVAPRLYTEADGWKPLQLWGMGIASADVTGDGMPEVFLTSQGDNKLQEIDPATTTGPSYRDIALQRGVTAQRPFIGGDVLPSTAWHPQFADINNDGYLDLFVTKGNVDAQVDYATRDPNNLFLGQPDGTFVEGADAAGIVQFGSSRGAAVVDLDLDGKLDLVVMQRRDNVMLWHNVSDDTGHWLGIQVTAPPPNVNAIGAWVDVRVDGVVHTQEVTIGGGHVSGQLGWLHVGLGAATAAEVRVQWPDGEVGPWKSVSADQFITVDRSAP